MRLPFMKVAQISAADRCPAADSGAHLRQHRWQFLARRLALKEQVGLRPSQVLCPHKINLIDPPLTPPPPCVDILVVQLYLALEGMQASLSSILQW